MRHFIKAALLIVALSPGIWGHAQEPDFSSDSASSSETFEFVNGDSVLQGRLFLPQGTGPFPAVVMLEGSGPSSYQRSWMPTVFPFWKEITEFALSSGYAVLLYDKPGVNDSTGDWRQQSFYGRAEEAVQAVRSLAGRPDIDASRIGLMGHSQGGWIAQIAGAQYSEDVAFLVLLAGPSITVKDQIIDDLVSSWRCAEASDTSIAVRKFGVNAGFAAWARLSSWFKVGYLSYIIGFDPRQELANITQPTLALFAGNDPLVLPDTNTDRLQKYFGENTGNQNLFIRHVDQADHFFRPSDLCPGTERRMEWAPEFFPALGDTQFWQRVTSDTP